MRTKEIQVWTGKDDRGVWWAASNERDAESIDLDNLVKAKLVIEAPEQKREISLSELREAWDKPFGAITVRPGYFQAFARDLGFDEILNEGE